MVPLILPRWELPLDLFDVGGLVVVQELCSARIASRWSADTDFGRRGAVPTAGVVVVSFLGGEGVGKVKPVKMCRTKNQNPGKVPTTRGNIW